MELSQAERETKWAELCEQVQILMKEFKVPGVAVGLLVDGQEYRQGFGVTSITNPLPVTDETLFQIGSTTKTVTATALMRLVEQGLVDLGAPVRRYLPDFRVADEPTAANVTVSHLLTHTAGWFGDFLTDTGAGDDACARHIDLMASLPQITPLGEIYTYNNVALDVVGRIIEVVTGKTYEAAVQELILTPLGMTTSFFFPTEVMIRRFAVGHVTSGGATVVAQPWHLYRGENACGGLSSTVQDQLRYARFQMGDGRAESGAEVLSPATMQQMQTAIVEAANGERVALTWFVQEAGGVRFVRHGGATNGQWSLFWMAPDQGVALTVLTNHETGLKFNQKLDSWVQQTYLGVVPEEPTLYDLSVAELRAYAGRYTYTPDTVIMELQDQRLMVRFEEGENGWQTIKSDPFPPSPVLMTARDKWLIQEGPWTGMRGQFLQTRDGRRWLRLASRLFLRQEG